jgi:DNA-binding NtrC family response regulator
MVIERILLLEDDEILRRDVEERLRVRGQTVVTASTLAAAREQVLRDRFDAIIADVRLPDGSGADLLPQLRTRIPRPIVIMISDFGSPESAVEAMRLGAFAFLLKPFSFDQFAVTLQKAEEHTRLLRVAEHLGYGDEVELLGHSGVMEELRRTVRAASRSRATVLVRGEPGTGKALVARALHRQSERAAEPFIRVDCAGIDPSELEAELFGRDGDGGADARTRRTGHLDLAQKGTLLLTGVGELPHEVQVKFVRLLTEKQFTRVGGSRSLSADVRLIATTARPLEDLVQCGQFRQDLMMMLSLLPIAVAPLRDRVEDIPRLVDHFRGRSSRQHGRAVHKISSRALEILQHHDWPGNVRELRQVIEQAAILCPESGQLEPKHLGGALTAAVSAVCVAEKDAAAGADVQKMDTLATVEKKHILAVLSKCGGNRTRAAAGLGISLRTLRNKLRQYRSEAASDFPRGSHAPRTAPCPS